MSLTMLWLNKAHKGKTPLWWKKINNLLKDNDQTRNITNKKYMKYINKESIQLKNKPFLPNLTIIDGRKNNCVVTIDENEHYIYGKLSTKKQTLWNNDNI